MMFSVGDIIEYYIPDGHQIITEIEVSQPNVFIRSIITRKEPADDYRNCYDRQERYTLISKGFHE
jgi:uncharacterized protein YehS (DUF1456 family)